MLVNESNILLRLAHEVFVVAHVLIIMIGPFPLPEQSKSVIINVRPNISHVVCTVPVMIPRRQANSHILEQNFASVQYFLPVEKFSFLDVGVENMFHQYVSLAEKPKPTENIKLVVIGLIFLDYLGRPFFVAFKKFFWPFWE